MIVTSQHLKNRDIERVISNFIQSGSTFLLTSNFPKTEVNKMMTVASQELNCLLISNVSDKQWAEWGNGISLPTSQPSLEAVFPTNTCEIIIYLLCWQWWHEWEWYWHLPSENTIGKRSNISDVFLPQFFFSNVLFLRHFFFFFRCAPPQHFFSSFFRCVTPSTFLSSSFSDVFLPRHQG